MQFPVSWYPDVPCGAFPAIKIAGALLQSKVVVLRNRSINNAGRALLTSTHILDGHCQLQDERGRGSQERAIRVAAVEDNRD